MLVARMRNVSHMLPYLSTWCPIGGAVWEGYGISGHIALLEEVCHLGKAQEIDALTSLPGHCDLSAPCRGHHAFPPPVASLLEI